MAENEEELFFDLKAAAEALGGIDPYRRFAGLVRKVNAVRSIVADLEVAHDRIWTAPKIRPPEALNVTKDQEREEAAILGGLFFSALVIYVRATHSGSKHRDQINFRDELNEVDLAAHKELVLLRNDVIAHFGLGNNLRDGAWAKDTLFFKCVGDNLSIFSTSERFNYKAHLGEDLARLVDRCLEIARSINDTRTSSLLTEINTLAVENREFRGRLGAFISHNPGKRRGNFLIPPGARREPLTDAAK